MKKKLFVGVLAVGIALMLVSMPYEANAQVGIIAATLIIGLGVGAITTAWWLSHNADKNNVQYDVNANNYINNWKSYLSHWENVINMEVNNSKNMVNLYNNMKLYWIRIAEHDVLNANVLNYNNWSKAKENMTAFKEFDNFTLSLVNNILNNYGLLYGDFAHELNGMAMLQFSDNSEYAYAQFGSSTTTEYTKVGKWYYGGWKTQNITKIHLWLDNSGLQYYNALNNNGYVNYSNMNEKVISDSNNIIISIRNLSVDDFHNLFNTTNAGNVKLCVGFVQTNNKFWAYLNEFLYDVLYNGNAEQGYAKIKFHNLTTEKYYTYQCTIDLHGFIDDLFDAYHNILDGMDNNAYLYWATLHDKGYYNASDVPANETLPLPDTYLGDINKLGDIPYNISLPLWYSILKQMSDSVNDLISKNASGNISISNMSIGDFYGKKANISLQKVNVDGSVITTYFIGHWCYVIPFQYNLTLYANKTYAITLQNPAWADVVYRYGINIFDLETMKFYTIYATNDTIYKMHVYGLKYNNKSVSSYGIDITNPNDFVNSHYGFTFTPMNGNENIPPPINSGNAGWFNWIAQHKDLLTIGLIVLGILFTASTRKSDGLHSLGIIMLLLGIGMAFYFYLLPAWHGISNFAHNLNPLHWFGK